MSDRFNTDIITKYSRVHHIEVNVLVLKIAKRFSMNMFDSMKNNDVIR
mgnify:CR=1 FL=1